MRVFDFGVNCQSEEPFSPVVPLFVSADSSRECVLSCLTPAAGSARG